jgi:hypothetical protein
VVVGGGRGGGALWVRWCAGGIGRDGREGRVGEEGRGGEGRWTDGARVAARPGPVGAARERGAQGV